jgi:deazaflavin-dependent oxidoreductase (nitroreductase family)
MHRIQRFFVRAPIQLYRFRLGGLLGKRFLLLEHVGRSSGLIRQAVLEVVDDAQADGPVIVSGLGESSQWFKNVSVEPDVWITRGTTRSPATAVRIGDDEARSVFERYRTNHPRAAKVIGKRIGVSLVDDLDEAAHRLPLFRLVVRSDH